MFLLSPTLCQIPSCPPPPSSSPPHTHPTEKATHVVELLSPTKNMEQQLFPFFLFQGSQSNSMIIFDTIACPTPLPVLPCFQENACLAPPQRSDCRCVRIIHASCQGLHRHFFLSGKRHDRCTSGPEPAAQENNRHRNFNCELQPGHVESW